MKKQKSEKIKPMDKIMGILMIILGITMVYYGLFVL